MRVRPYLIAVFICFVSHAMFGQASSADSSLKSANRLYSTGAYESAELTARRAMEQGPIADSVRIEAERIIAFSLVAQGKSDLARDHFEVILATNPSFALDPILTSPKILTVFQEARLRYTASHAPASVEEKGNRGAFSGITYRTILFPGWEQYHQGRTTTGLILAGAGVVALGSALTFESLRAPARKDYLAATLPADIASKYDRYNRYYHGEVYSCIAFAAVYIASELDVFLNTETMVEVRPSLGNATGSSLSVSFPL